MRRWIPLACALTLGMAALGSAHAGPIRDRLMQRAAQHHAQELDEEDSTISANGPFDLPAGAQVERDIAYGPDAAERLDVYRPAHAEKAPVVFMVHGGGWRTGDKGLHRVVKNKVGHWVGQGYLLVSINYPLVPQANPLQQADEVAKAMAFAQSHAASWGGDARRFVLMGHSAGAHLVALIAADPSIATRQGAQPWLGTVPLDSAAYDVASIMQGRHFRLYDQAFKRDTALWHDASPIERLKAAPSPMLLVCSSRRQDSCEQAQAFAAKANGLGGRVTVLPEDLTHAEINDRLGLPGDYTAAVDRFMKSLGLP